MAVLVTGASGYVGKLIAATLLQRESVRLVLPVRSTSTTEAVLSDLSRELAADDGTAPALDRVRIVPLPAFDRLDELDPIVSECNVTEIVHCAGCLDYFDREALHLVNVEFTRLMIEQARRWNIRRFTYISTAFSSGYRHDEIPEALHPDPEVDPTEYTRTKREAEHVVAQSGVPFLCIRPAIIIGDSRTGRYSGKQYGLYQLWSGIERLLCAQWEPEFYVVSGDQPTSLVHQDAFQNAFHAAWRSVADGAFVNIVSSPTSAPRSYDLWDYWMEECFHPEIVHYYRFVTDLPVASMPRRQRALMALASTNLEIGNFGWKFDASNLATLCKAGTSFAHATRETVLKCQRVFMAESPRIQAFIRDIRPPKAIAGRYQKTNHWQVAHQFAGNDGEASLAMEVRSDRSVAKRSR